MTAYSCLIAPFTLSSSAFSEGLIPISDCSKMPNLKVACLIVDLSYSFSLVIFWSATEKNSALREWGDKTGAGFLITFTGDSSFMSRVGFCFGFSGRENICFSYFGVSYLSLGECLGDFTI